jgi:hypothetical protein
MKPNSSAPFFLVFALLGAVTIVPAQEQGQSYPASESQSQAQPAPQQVWSSEQLDNLVAPIALYPDPLLGQILVASTYPLEVVEASQWLQRNRNLRNQELVDSAKKQPWDPSVQALVAIPDGLAKLNQDIRWTTDLGNAFLAQEADVMSAVQRMRVRAQDKGRLSSTPQQTVTTEEQGGREVIVIQPASPQVIYVPTYDPVYIWGPPLYGYYPPLYYPVFGFGFGVGFNLGFCFDGWGGWGGWGWGPSWYGHSVFINNYFFYHHGFHQHYRGNIRGMTAWTHDPAHRMHVPYGNSQTAARFGAGSMGSRNSFRSGAGPTGAASAYVNRSVGRSVGRTGEQANRNVSPQAQSFRNPERQRYQYSQQYRSETQTQRFQGQPQQRYQASRQYQVAPQVQRFQSQPQQRYQAPRQYQVAPQAQRFQSQPQQRYQVPQQYRAAPQMSGPRSNSSGNFGRGSSGSFNPGGGGNFSRGGGGSHHR